MVRSSLLALAQALKQAGRAPRPKKAAMAAMFQTSSSSKRDIFTHGPYEGIHRDRQFGVAEQLLAAMGRPLTPDEIAACVAREQPRAGGAVAAAAG